jgi:hypothetical protein
MEDDTKDGGGTGSVVHPASHPVGAGLDADHPPLYCAEVENTWSYTSTPIHIRGVMLSQDRDSFTFTLSMMVIITMSKR